MDSAKGTNTFVGIESLVGGTAQDSFTLQSTVTTFKAANAGGGCPDSLPAPDGTNTWLINASNAGSLNTSTTFTQVENLTGGTGADSFTLSATGNVSGTIAGGLGTDTLTGNDLTSTWSISAANAGTLNDANGTNTFAGIESLVGGTAQDSFTLQSTVTTFNGSIAGGGGTDTLAATDGTNAWVVSGNNEIGSASCRASMHV